MRLDALIYRRIARSSIIICPLALQRIIFRTTTAALAFCLLSAILPPAAAQAQEASPAQRAVLEEIVVTARRRAEDIQETPIAVTALGADELRERGINNVEDLGRIVPSLQIVKDRTSAIFIRGVGERTGFARVDPSVGVYLDDLFLPRADGQLLDTVDIENIQVLRGPQGTLFGKNTTGGAMVLTLAKPHDSFEGYAEVGYGSFNQYRARAGINMPVADRFFVRAAGNFIKDDGYIKDLGTGNKTGSSNRMSAMLQGRWEINDDMTLDTLFYYGKIDESIPGVHCNIVNENALFMKGLWAQWSGDTDPSNPTAFRNNCETNSRERTGDFKTRMGENPYMTRELDTFMVGGTWDWHYAEYHSLKLVAGFREERKGPQYLGDNDGGPEKFSEAFGVDYVKPSRRGERQSYSLELQFNGDLFARRLTYTMGLFGMNETNEEPFTLFTALAGIDLTTLGQLAQGQRPTQPPPGGTTPMVGILSDPIRFAEFGLENTTLAAFLQTSFDITSQLELTTGIRFTAERRAADLTVLLSDRDAIAARIQGTGLFGPSLGGFHAYHGPLRWLDDPVRIANDLFPDTSGDGIPNFPLDHDNPFVDKRKETFREATPMVSLSYIFSESWLTNTPLDSMMIYGTWSAGFKSGFFEPRGVDGLERIEPETVENREIGFKIEALQRSLRLNVAIYSMDFDNMQLIQVQTDSNGALQVIFQNAAESKIRGGELELTWLPLRDMMFNLSYSNNYYAFVDFTDLDLATLALEGEEKLIDRSRESFPTSPRVSFSAGVQYAWHTGLGTFVPRLDAHYQSERYFGIDHGAYLAFRRDSEISGDKPFTVMNLRLSWSNPSGNTTLTAFVENLADRRYVLNAGGVGDSIGTNTGPLAKPRAYGINFRQLF